MFEVFREFHAPATTAPAASAAADWLLLHQMPAFRDQRAARQLIKHFSPQCSTLWQIQIRLA